MKSILLQYKKNRQRGMDIRKLIQFQIMVSISAILLLGGCTKDDSLNGQVSPATGLPVKVNLNGLALDDVTDVYALPSSTQRSLMAPLVFKSLMPDSSNCYAMNGAFNVSLPSYNTGDVESSVPLESVAAPPSRAAQTLKNCWVFQFSITGQTLKCEKVGTLAVGVGLELTLNTVDECTIGVIANGPESGLTSTNIPNLTAFSESLLCQQNVNTLETLPYAGLLPGVSVHANGKVSYSQGSTLWLERVYAEVTVQLDFDVEDLTLDGVEMYNVPVGASYGSSSADVFPVAVSSNFGYTDSSTKGLAPHAKNGNNYTWYLPENIRGSVESIETSKDKASNKAPEYASFARVKCHYQDQTTRVIYYDIYLGRNMTSNFNIERNNRYTYITTIKGTAEDHFWLTYNDERVTGRWPEIMTTLKVEPGPGVPTLTSGIPQAGGAYIVSLYGDLSGTRNVRVCRDDDPINTVTMTPANNQTNMSIPALKAWQPSTISFQYQDRGGQWTGDLTYVQAPYSITAFNVTPQVALIDGYLPPNGGNVTVSLEGTLPPSTNIRALFGESTINGNVPSETSATLMTIPSFVGWGIRKITFGYEKDSGTWIDAAELAQTGYSVNRVLLNGSTSDYNNLEVGGAPATITITIEGILPETFKIIYEGPNNSNTTATLHGTSTVLTTTYTLPRSAHVGNTQIGRLYAETTDGARVFLANIDRHGAQIGANEAYGSSNAICYCDGTKADGTTTLTAAQNYCKSKGMRLLTLEEASSMPVYIRNNGGTGYLAETYAWTYESGGELKCGLQTGGSGFNTGLSLSKANPYLVCVLR